MQFIAQCITHNRNQHDHHITITPPCHQVKYSEFQAGLRALNVRLNRKVLSELAMSEPFSFRALAEQVKLMRGVGGGGGGGGSSGGVA